MQLLCDAIAVLGSRHGLVFDPVGRSCRVIRFDTFEQSPVFELRAGLVVEGRSRCFPLAAVSEGFDFVDQRSTPCTISWIGVDAAAALKVTLKATTPFRPRDLEFSSTPSISLSIAVERVPGQFRWIKPVAQPEEVELFFELGSGALTPISGPENDEIDVCFTTWLRPDNDPGAPRRAQDACLQRDRLVAPGSIRSNRGFRKKIRVDGDEALNISWCAWPGAALSIDGVRCEFWHARRFPDLEAVVKWARRHSEEFAFNATHVDRTIRNHGLGQAVDHLLAYTLHSWAINTWLTDRGGAPWFSVWEGSCYFHSTLDVEFTQAPFYLAVWPELLRMQLKQWAERSCDGESCVGKIGSGTRYMPHDVGRYAEVGTAAYPHAMEVEETGNFLLLVFAEWKRTGDRSLIEVRASLLIQLSAFLRACDTDGSGVPALGVANTIDDGSPAIQFGHRQVYLAMKAHAALRVAAEMLTDFATQEQIDDWSSAASRILAVVEDRAWCGDHYAVLLERSGRLQNPWTKEWTYHAEIPGWNAFHIYTANTFPILDMVGFELGLDPNRVAMDLREATRRCLREYGCTHTDFHANTRIGPDDPRLAGVALEPGWISMNILRDLAALRRGVGVLSLAERYWEWQVLTNSQAHGPQLFFETFAGNHLCFYPRGLAVWGIFEAVSGQVIDRVSGRDYAKTAWPELRVPRLWDCAWRGFGEAIPETAS